MKKLYFIFPCDRAEDSLAAVCVVSQEEAAKEGIIPDEPGVYVDFMDVLADLQEWKIKNIVVNGKDLNEAANQMADILDAMGFVVTNAFEERKGLGI